MSQLGPEARKVDRILREMHPATPPLKNGARRGWWIWHRLSRDLSYAARTLCRNPAFALASILILALGIGAGAAVFSVTYDLALKKLPYPNAEQLYRVTERRLDGKFWTPFLSGAEFDYLSKLPQVARIGCFMPAEFVIHSGRPQALQGALVSAGLFATLGTQPLLGRTIGSADAVSGAPNTVVLSDELWDTEFGANPHVLGQQIWLAVKAGGQPDGRVTLPVPFTIIGVMPPRSRFPLPGKLWVALTRPAHPVYRDMMGNSLAALGKFETYVRLRRGTGALAFRQSLASEDTRLAQAFPELAEWRLHAERLRDAVVGEYRARLLVWLAASVCILLLTCLTVSNLMMGRARSSASESAVRLALGATRTQLVGQSLMLSGLISAIAGAVGIGLAYAALKACAALPPPGAPRPEAIAVSWPILGSLLGAAVLLGLLFGVLPAMQFALPNLQRRLQSSGGPPGSGTSMPRLRPRSAAVAVEVGLALVLTLGAILAAVSLGRLGAADLGYPTGNLVVARISPGPGSCSTVSACGAFLEALVRRVQATPGVARAAATTTVPMGLPVTFQVYAGGSRIAAGKPTRAQFVEVTPGYFQTMGVRIVAGRGIQRRDQRGAERVVVVSRSLARELFGAHAVGRSLLYAGPPTRVVGVVGDVSMRPEARPLPTFYIPVAQAFFLQQIGLVVRAAGSPQLVVRELPGALASVDPTAALSHAAGVNNLLAAVSAGPEYQEIILTFFGGLGVVLALAGVYGLVHYETSQRAREFAVRIALGASRCSVAALALTRTLSLACLGLAAGAACYLAAAASIRSAFYGAVSLSGPTVAAVAAAVFTAAVLAALPPALRAASAAPMDVLRES